MGIIKWGKLEKKQKKNVFKLSYYQLKINHYILCWLHNNHTETYRKHTKENGKRVSKDVITHTEKSLKQKRIQ